MRCALVSSAGRRGSGFARIVTDRATVPYLGDVYILDAYQGQGLGKWLMQTIVSHPDLPGLRRWMRVTRDAHGLDRQFSFRPLEKPDGYMERRDMRSYSDGT